MTTTAIRPSSTGQGRSFRLPGWILILSILGFVATVATYAVIFTPAGIGEFTFESPESIRGDLLRCAGSSSAASTG